MLLDIFNKKKEEVKVEAINLGTTPVEIGKTVQFQDPKTGQIVYQQALSLEHRKILMGAMQRNGETIQVFIQDSLAYFNALDKCMETRKAIQARGAEVDAKFNEIREELKLPKDWGFNTQLGLLERRVSPGG